MKLKLFLKISVKASNIGHEKTSSFDQHPINPQPLTAAPAAFKQRKRSSDKDAEKETERSTVKRIKRKKSSDKGSGDEKTEKKQRNGQIEKNKKLRTRER